MASFVTRAACALLMLAVALCFATCGAADSTSLYSMMAGVNGASYFWQTVSDLMESNAALKTEVKTAIQHDLETAAGADVTVAYRTMLVNESAMYLEYDATVAASSPTEAEVQARVATSTFPELTALIVRISTLSNLVAVSDLVPKSLMVTNPLYKDPNGDAPAGTAYVGSVEYEVVVMFSGKPSAWTSVLVSDYSTVSENIVSAVHALLDSSKQYNDVRVNAMRTLAADTNKKTMGSGAGGMVARLSVTCYATAAMTGRFLSTSEYASVLLLLDTATLTATFQATSGSSSTVVAEETTSVAALDVADKCDSACKGMIAMTAVIAALAVACAVLACIAICCPCGIIKSPRDVYARQLREKFGVQTEVEEAIDVYGGEGAAEAHEPATTAPLHRKNNEPNAE